PDGTVTQGGTVIITDAPVTAHAGSAYPGGGGGGTGLPDEYSPTEGDTYSGTVGWVYDPMEDEPTSEYTATVAWGDGTTTSPSLERVNPNWLAVTATHTFLDETEGDEDAWLLITTGGGDDDLTELPPVADALLHEVDGPPAVTITEGAAWGATLFRFTDDFT